MWGSFGLSGRSTWRSEDDIYKTCLNERFEKIKTLVGTSLTQETHGSLLNSWVIESLFEIN